MEKPRALYPARAAKEKQMYRIDKTNEYLLVELEADFDYSTIKQITYNETMMSEVERLNDIWLIGKHRAHLRLGDIQLLVDDFKRLYTRTNDTKKIAMVVQQGLTEAIIQLLASGIHRCTSVSCCVFHTVDEARQWIQAKNSQVA